MMIEPLPTLDKVFSLVLGQEKQLSTPLTQPSESKPPTLASQTQPHHSCGCSSSRDRVRNYPSNGRGEASTRVCIHYGRNNHMIEHCFDIHGYPPGFQQRGKIISVNFTSADFTSTTPSPSTCQDQYTQLLNLLQQHLTTNAPPTTTTPLDSDLNSIVSSTGNVNTISSPLGKHFTPWIIYNGATHHITYSLSNLSIYHTISSFTMKMPNGHASNATISRTIVLSDNIKLTMVYYIPSFTVNLISVTQLTIASD